MVNAVTLLVGTTKGAFLICADEARADWSIKGPLCDLWPINHMIGDPESGCIWAVGGGDWDGAGVWRSQDWGQTWELANLSNGSKNEMVKAHADAWAYLGLTPQPDGPFQGQLEATWSLCKAGGKLWLGAKPGVLLTSVDQGKTWSMVDGFNKQSDRETWEPGAIGLIPHTLVSDPDDPNKIWLGMSASGIFATEDGGQTWERRNAKSEASGQGPQVGNCGQEVGHCVHNLVRANIAEQDVLYQQNHFGVFKSQDGGRSWEEITQGLPSTFGFPIAVSPHDPNQIWVFPLNGDIKGRFPPEAKARVWHSNDAGETWEAQSNGLPEGPCFFTVLRQSMSVDTCDQSGVYFGTNSGSLFASFNGGEEWREIASHLPTILSVTAVTH